MPTFEFTAGADIETVRNRFGRLREIRKITRETYETKSIRVREKPMSNPEFYIVLKNDELTEALENAVYEAGFDDSSLTMRGGGAAIWIRHRPGELTAVVRQALEQATKGGLRVSHVEMESEVFA
jgi:hypothetical protein